MKNLDISRLTESELSEFILGIIPDKRVSIDRSDLITTFEREFPKIKNIPGETTSRVYEWYLSEILRGRVNQNSQKYKLTELLALPREKVLEFSKFLQIPTPINSGYPLTPSLEEFLKDRIIRVFYRVNLVSNDIFDGDHAKVWTDEDHNGKSGDLINQKERGWSICNGKGQILFDYDPDLDGQGILPCQFHFPKYPLGYWYTLNEGKWINQLEMNEWIDLRPFESEIMDNLRGPIHPDILCKDDRLYLEYPEIIYRSLIKSGKIYNLEFMVSSRREILDLISQSPVPIEYGGHGYFVLGGIEISQ